METPSDRLYTDGDEWILIEDGEGLVGITDYAQDQLGDIVYVELPEVGSTFGRGDTFGVVESVKAVADLYAPVAGTVLATNDDLRLAPELVNSFPYDQGWMIRLRMDDPEAREGLLEAGEYEATRPDAEEEG